MALKALNIKMDESDILDMKSVAGVYNMTLTELMREAIRDKIEELKRDPFYRLTANVQEASTEESEEILTEIEKMTDDDLTIVSSKKFTA